jgi:ribosome-binding protein aMBF1 (putative translation factor)
MACDICGKTGTHLVDLTNTYKTAEIQQVCPDCEKVLNKHVAKLRSVTGNILVDWMRTFIRVRKQQAVKDQSNG